MNRDDDANPAGGALGCPDGDDPDAALAVAAVPVVVSAIHVGGDAAGLAFVVGCVVIFTMGLPPLRWFVAASALLAVGFATAVIGWHRTHSMWSEHDGLLRGVR